VWRHHLEHCKPEAAGPTSAADSWDFRYSVCGAPRMVRLGFCTRNTGHDQSQQTVLLLLTLVMHHLDQLHPRKAVPPAGGRCQACFSVCM
jgi:hypothetical protein